MNKKMLITRWKDSKSPLSLHSTSENRNYVNNRSGTLIKNTSRTYLLDIGEISVMKAAAKGMPRPRLKPIKSRPMTSSSNWYK